MAEKTKSEGKGGQSGEALRFVVALVLGLAIAGASLAFLFSEDPEPVAPPAVKTDAIASARENRD